MSSALPTTAADGFQPDPAAVAAAMTPKTRALFVNSPSNPAGTVAENERLAALMRGKDDYSVAISETHHIHKLDAPSGTALTLRNQIVESGKRKVESVPIESIREGEVPGTHTVTYDSEIDTLTLTHEAHSRKGLALGAVLAAEWLLGKRGVFSMREVIGR